MMRNPYEAQHRYAKAVKMADSVEGRVGAHTDRTAKDWRKFLRGLWRASRAFRYDVCSGAEVPMCSDETWLLMTKLLRERHYYNLTCATALGTLNP